jgi:hypothetical protein
MDKYHVSPTYKHGGYGLGERSGILLNPLIAP